MIGSNRAESEAGFVLVEVLVAMAILAMATTIIYSAGNELLQQDAVTLNRTAALSNLQTYAKILGRLGKGASSLLPATDQQFQYEYLDAPLADRPAEMANSPMVFGTLRAVDLLSDRTLIAIDVIVHE